MDNTKDNTKKDNITNGTNDETMLTQIIKNEMGHGFKFATVGGAPLATPEAVLEETRLRGKYLVEPQLLAGSVR